MGLSIAVYDSSHITASLMSHRFSRVTTYNHGIGLNYKQPTFAIAEKVTENGEHIIAVVIRGTDSVSNWLTNVSVGTGSFHEGFYDSASYISQKLHTDYQTSGDTTYFITGFSQGAAIANLLAADLIESGNRVTAYTFATPNVTRGQINPDIDIDIDYTGIYNICNTLDLVTVLPTHLTGNEWRKYGDTIWFREEFFNTSFFTHHEQLYLSVMSRLQMPDEYGIIGDINEQYGNVNVVNWNKIEKIRIRRI
jgi:hypothetical protein